MRPTLRQMEYLVAIADSGTFNEAAEITHVSQPSLSAQIKDMEAYLGVTLIERGRHGALLTEIGDTVVQQARLILHSVEALKIKAREAHGALSGTLKFGTLPSVGPYLLPKAVRRLHENYPDLQLEIREERSGDLQTDLMAGVLDIIISTPEEHPGTVSMPIVTENIYACVAADDPLASSRGDLPVKALAGRELLTLGRGHKLAKTVQILANEVDAHTAYSYEGNSLDAIRQMASMGTGVAILPSLYAVSEAKRDPDLIVRRIKHKSANRPISLIWRQSSPLGDRFKMIGQDISETAREIMQS